MCFEPRTLGKLLVETTGIDELIPSDRKIQELSHTALLSIGATRKRLPPGFKLASQTTLETTDRVLICQETVSLRILNHYIDMLVAGESVPPIIVTDDYADFLYLLDGNHRLIAHHLLALSCPAEIHRHDNPHQKLSPYAYI